MISSGSRSAARSLPLQYSKSPLESRQLENLTALNETNRHSTQRDVVSGKLNKMDVPSENRVLVQEAQVKKKTAMAPLPFAR